MGGVPDDPETRRRQRALFRHAIIGELDIEALPRGERSARLAELAARTYQTPGGRERRFTARTLWWSKRRDQFPESGRHPPASRGASCTVRPHTLPSRDNKLERGYVKKRGR